MKIKWQNLSFILFFIFGLTVSNAQVITLEPALPVDTDSVLITFHADQGAAALAGYTGDVYAHTGVKTEGNTQWQYVIGDWGVNTSQPKLTRISTNTYTLKISPSIREYYNVPAGQKIVQLCFVFRAATGSPQSEDLFADVYEDGLTVDILSPSPEQTVYELGDTIPVIVNARLSDSVNLYINNTLFASTHQSEIIYQYVAEDYGTLNFRATASDSINTVADSILVFIRSQVHVETLPANTRPGLNRINDSTVIFALHDPAALKSYCFVTGSFNNWLIGESGYMKRTPDGKYYWLQITGLNPDTEYIYQYYIDGEIRIADPYTNKTSDPWNDQYISQNNYPGLISYPVGKTTGICSTFKINQENYEWEVESFEPPARENLVIYELHIRDFIEGDHIQTVTDSLNYLENLGVTAIELMPFNEFEGNDSWGYNPSFYFAPDKNYGTPQHYKQFIDACHKRGIAVIMDMVLNHSFGQSPFVQMYFNSSTSQPSAQNPWYNQSCPHQPWCWGSDFNHESPYTEALVDSILRFWMTEYKVDGFRFDFTKGFSNVNNDGWAYNSQRIANLKRMADRMWEVNPNAYVILEHLTDNAEEKELANYGMLLWGNLNYNYNEATMGWNNTSNFSGINYKNRGWNSPHLIGYMESHDEERLMFKNIQYGNQSGDYNIKDTITALKRIELAAAFFFTVPGPKMIWQFGELGYDISIDFNGRVGRKPIKWNYYFEPERKKLYDVFSAFIKLKKTYPVFSTDDFSLSVSGSVKKIYLNSPDIKIVCAGNFGVVEDNIQPLFPTTGYWYDYFSGDSILISATDMALPYLPGEYHLYSSKRLKAATPSIKDILSFPNPSDKQIKIITQSPINRIFISDATGQIVFDSKYAQVLEVNLEIAGFERGIYFVFAETTSGLKKTKIVRY